MCCGGDGGMPINEQLAEELRALVDSMGADEVVIIRNNQNKAGSYHLVGEVTGTRYKFGGQRQTRGVNVRDAIIWLALPRYYNSYLWDLIVDAPTNSDQALTFVAQKVAHRYGANGSDPILVGGEVVELTAADDVIEVDSVVELAGVIGAGGAAVNKILTPGDTGKAKEGTGEGSGKPEGDGAGLSVAELTGIPDPAKSAADGSNAGGGTDGTGEGESGDTAAENSPSGFIPEGMIVSNAVKAMVEEKTLDLTPLIGRGTGKDGAVKIGDVREHFGL